MWMSWTPLPGEKPNTLSGVPGSGPHRCPKAYALAAGSAIAARLPPAAEASDAVLIDRVTEPAVAPVA